MSEVKFRSSCDACLNSKVKCSQTKPACNRCREQGNDCVYSRYRKIGRPSYKSLASIPEYHGPTARNGAKKSKRAGDGRIAHPSLSVSPKEEFETAGHAFVHTDEYAGRNSVASDVTLSMHTEQSRASFAGGADQYVLVSDAANPHSFDSNGLISFPDYSDFDSPLAASHLDGLTDMYIASTVPSPTMSTFPQQFHTDMDMHRATTDMGFPSDPNPRCDRHDSVAHHLSPISLLPTTGSLNSDPQSFAIPNSISTTEAPDCKIGAGDFMTMSQHAPSISAFNNFASQEDSTHDILASSAPFYSVPPSTSMPEPCHCQASLAECLSELNQHHTHENTRLPLDVLLDLDDRTRAPREGILKCAACLSPARSGHSLHMVTMLISQLFDLFEREHTVSQQSQGYHNSGTSTPCFMHTSTPLTIGHLQLDESLKLVFLRQLLQSYLDRQLNTILQLMQFMIDKQYQSVSSTVLPDLLQNLYRRVQSFLDLVTRSDEGVSDLSFGRTFPQILF